jgi:60S ribosome subunit biogenesis protein NIP7
MQYRLPNALEETILKRSYSKWNIFELYDNEKLIISTVPSSVTKSTLKTDLQTCNPYVQNNTKPADTRNKMKNPDRKQTQINDSNLKKVYLWARPPEHVNLLLNLYPILMGIQIGIIKSKKFLPGLNFAEMVLEYHKNTRFEFPHVVVNDKAANLVCFGRDILGSSLISCYDKIRDNQLLIILNENNEVLGLGRSRFASPLLSRPNVITIDTIENIGTFYLQNENKDKSLMDLQ